MVNSSLFTLSPLDGRYFKITASLRPYFSEAALIKYRLLLEIKYLQALSEITVVRTLTPKELFFLTTLSKPTPHNLNSIKSLEETTHHDVKVIEYYLQSQFETTTLKDLIPFIHFALTSEDVNNLAYRLMVKSAHKKVMLPQLKIILSNLASFISHHSSLPILARTHGQPAIPTTFGKEISVFAVRFLHDLIKLDNLHLTGKLNGAVGGFQAHHLAYPQIDWLTFSSNFVQQLKLQPQLHTTQINPPDDLTSLFQTYHHLNSVLIGLCQDIWRYISDDWLIQKGKTKKIGSSTMPQKINPIEFENAEGNLILANGYFETLNRKLPISRLQRDLSDSTVMRHLGVAFGHCLVGYSSLLSGLTTITPNPQKINPDLNFNYNLLGEALQTVLRKQGNANAYETVAAVFKQKIITPSTWKNLVKTLAPELTHLTPSTYLGLSNKLALLAVKEISQYLKLNP